MGNPDLPEANVDATDQLGVLIASSSDRIAIAGTCEKGALLTPTEFSSGADLFSTHGYGRATEMLARHIEQTNKPGIFVRMAATGGATRALDADSVTGTAVPSLAGTPLDDHEAIVEITTGGTLGTAGIVFRYSLDGGKNYSAKIALGTALTYAIPGTGVTVTFGASAETLVAEDSFSWVGEAGSLDANEFDDLFTKFAEGTTRFRLLAIPETLSKAALDLLETQVVAYKTTTKRHIRVMTQARPRYLDCRCIGDPSLTFAAGPPGTITRAAGDFVSDGFKAGMTITVTGSTSNDGSYTVETVAATVLTMVSADTIAVEAGATGVEITGSESKTAYRTAIRDEYDAFSSSQGRILNAAGELFIRSVLHRVKWQLRRSPAWAAATRAYQFGPHESLGKVKNGRLPTDVAIHDASGSLIAWDSRVDRGLSSEDGSNGRHITVRTYEDTRVFIALPITMHEPGSGFSRLHLGFVTDIACEIAQAAATEELQNDVFLDSLTGNALEAELKRAEGAVNQQLRLGLLEPTDGRGPRVSSATLTILRPANLATPGSGLSGRVRVVPKGYVEGFDIIVALTNPAAEAA